jgi:hypothetical protein
MFKIGDKVFQASYGRQERWITCPDCLGSKRVKVILGDGTEVSIECGGCYPGGYEPSRGAIRQYDFAVEVTERTVTGVCMHGTEVKYELDNHGGSYYTGDDTTVFATVEEARAKGERDKAEHEEAENKRFLAKTKDHHSWAWNSTYHRRCAEKARKEMEYHQDKARVCAAKAKAA